jgi:hypothetical protein
VRHLYTTSTGRVFAWTSTTLFELFSGGTFLSRGTIPTGTAPISASDNGQQMVFSVEGQGRLYTFATDALAPLPTTGPATWGHFGYIDSRFVVSEPGTRTFWYSELLDGATWPALYNYQADARPDIITGLLVDHRQILLFGPQSIEVWDPTGQAPPPTSLLGPFARNQSVAIEQGTDARWGMVAANNSFYWLGGSARGEGPVWRLDGYTPRRISTAAIETAMSHMDTVGDAIAFAASWGGHSWVGFYFPTGQQTWLLDTNLESWTELADLKDDGSLEAFRSYTHAFSAGEHIWGDRSSGQIYLWDKDYHLYGSDPIYRERTTAHLRKEQDRVRYASFGVLCEAGVGLDGGVVPGTDPQVMLSYSDDGGKTFSYPRRRSLGKIGKGTQLVMWRQLGQSRQRAFRVVITDPVDVALLGASVEAG